MKISNHKLVNLEGSTKGKSLSNIQLLRAFAALNVVMFHIIYTATDYGFSVLFWRVLESWGRSGVDLFFVISGFVMIYIQHHKNKSSVAFFVDRLLRIVPTYWFLSIFLALVLVLLPSVFRQMHFSPSWLVSSLLFLSGVLEEQKPILFVGWTIEYEMFFYLIFSVSLLATTLRSSIFITTFSLVVAIGIFHADMIFLEFIFGMLIGYLYLSQNSINKFGLISLMLGICFLLVSLVAKDSGLNRVLLFGIPSCLILFGCVNLRQVHSGVFTKVGDASYSIYLIQIFTIPAFYKLVTLGNLRWLPVDLLAFLCLLVTAVVGIVFYELFEVRVSGLVKRLK